MSFSSAAYGLSYTADHTGGNCRPHHLAWFVDTREEILRIPGVNRVEITTGTRFMFDPDYVPIVWTRGERRRGPAWGVPTVPTYGTLDLSRAVTGPPIPATSQISVPSDASRRPI